MKGTTGGRRATSTVATRIDDLSASFTLCLQFYSQWRRCRGSVNHYRRPENSGAVPKPPVIAPCALSASLDMGAQTRETFTIGLAILGPDYAQGDDMCCRALAIQQDLLQDQVALLRTAIASATKPLDINVILKASETVRVATINALVELYRRMAAGRPGIPRALPVPKWRSPSLRSKPPKTKRELLAMLPAYPPSPGPSTCCRSFKDDDATTTRWSVLSSPLVFQSEPPSPPLTATMSECVAPLPSLPELVFNASAAGKRASYQSWVRPQNSVFNIFCPEAMALQVDVYKLVPSARKCRCGYRWQERASTRCSTRTSTRASTRASARSGSEDKSIIHRNKSISSMESSASFVSARSTRTLRHSPSTTTIVLKDGFSLSPRFLAKSHCEGAESGFGCVLCTSNGLTETYGTAEDLRVHINTTHDKWQMLHDRDLA
ncbi:hypothetical protein CMQ_502 [Grosmannia clavigera kw1407]|uniref:Uncharacterized protein n=1 Tax=Grosmannia clavigera (strain kw1407 / UAMH 11150) TaxID=655863 RepID=F0XCG9_GROCL|nr:uncharacterized protein CMQ_502 [Grosmannia clavigera kw1407]EFX03574.1 hypothetical protein CMQ_502 [Grosmannia clavigera kw1407]